MREICVSLITQTICRLCIESNCILPKEVENTIGTCFIEEPWPPARVILKNMLENIEIARFEHLPLCQDTGVACVFLEIGQEAHLIGGDLYEAVNEGVRQGYRIGYLRKSVVCDPISRKNTTDNTPASIHYEIVPGDRLNITVAPKGFGSENMSKLIMLKPSDGIEGVKSFILDTVCQAGPNPCPPIVVGVGIGGTFEGVALLAKKALIRDFSSANPNTYYTELETKLLNKINELGIGPQGFGGKTTALKVNIETLPTHIAGLPVAVNIGCHVTRYARAVL